MKQGKLITVKWIRPQSAAGPLHHCRRCHHPLSASDSIAHELGPVCYEKEQYEDKNKEQLNLRIGESRRRTSCR